MNFGSLTSMFPGLQHSVPNPYVPLSFEDLGGDVSDAEFTSRAHFDVGSLAMDAATLGHSQVQDSFVTPQAYAATKRAMEAHSYTRDQEAAAKAREALQISPLCPEAYIVLAMRGSRSYEEALGHFRTAVEQGTQILKPEFTKIALADKEIWGRVPMRAWFRGVYGVGNTLRKMGRYKEALEKYTLLIKHQPKPSGSSSYHNFHAHLPELWCRVHGPSKCLEMMKRHPHAADTCELNSCLLPWVFNMALANFATGKMRVPFALRLEFGGDQLLKNNLAGGAALAAVAQNMYVVELLAGERPMPCGKIPMTVPASDSPMQAAIYVKDCRDLWEGCPGAIPFLVKMRNTVLAAQELRKAVENPRGPFNAALVEKCIKNGVFLNESIPILQYSNSLLGAVSLLGGRPEAAGLARALLEAGARIEAPIGHDSPMTPLHMACYYAAGPEVVRLLVEAGGDVLLGERVGPRGSRDAGPAIDMTCNQGNYRELDAILTARPDLCSPTCRKRHLQLPNLKLPNQSVLQFLFGNLLFTSCLTCLNGGPKCERCLHDRPHGPHASFTGCVDVLVKHGLRATPELVKCLKSLLRVWSHPREAREMQQLVNYFLELPGARQQAPSRTDSGDQSAGTNQGVGATGAGTPVPQAAAARRRGQQEDKGRQQQGRRQQHQHRRLERRRARAGTAAGQPKGCSSAAGARASTSATETARRSPGQSTRRCAGRQPQPPAMCQQAGQRLAASLRPTLAAGGCGR